MTPPILTPAGNASTWTGPTGNNTWLLPGAVPALIDAGVGLTAHVEAVAAALQGAPLSPIPVAHHHPDPTPRLPAPLSRRAPAGGYPGARVDPGTNGGVGGGTTP